MPAPVSLLQATPPLRGDQTGRKNMQQLIELRWIAVLGQIGTILAVPPLFDIQLPLRQMLTLVLALAIFNLISVLRLRLRMRVSRTELFVALLVDVAILTLLLQLSGGTSNPFVFLYLLQVALAAVLLPPAYSWAVVAVATACFAGLALTGQTLELPADHDQGLRSPYVQGMLAYFILNASLLVVFIHRISRNLRSRDAHLAALRQRAAEEEHIVRMGLLASGAAHELGTPLATMAVILGDWQHMRAFAEHPEILQEVQDLQAQVLRCKTIVNGILSSAGEARGVAPTPTTVHRLLDGLAAEWRAAHPRTRLVYENHFGEDLRILSDQALKQMLGNVLDNACEASPDWLHLEVRRQDDDLVLTVTDAGPGFRPEMLAHLGTPYRSSKGRPGGGLGLFLAMNVARMLGGSISARNLPQHGAAVTVTLPLSALALDADSSPNAPPAPSYPVTDD